ncbi:hypothetical protein COT48_05130 [Candidatus Woesearchaeota archaeon CG08_land_8_20_14_0_20_47_9]|nr:MAG: hypothetical protein COV22_01955 [Candidatus Woesearchaeota archaeon CG10_big_fil_rev_8_21_14_0_10_47_5]PIO03379.1 MAG: hypothetical protein COT48_05130 [Candidatus Woesearchaeota archaeon CG08_land_8_20_14_0_20_47_9]
MLWMISVMFFNIFLIIALPHPNQPAASPHPNSYDWLETRCEISFPASGLSKLVSLLLREQAF